MARSITCELRVLWWRTYVHISRTPALLRLHLLTSLLLALACGVIYLDVTADLGG